MKYKHFHPPGTSFCSTYNNILTFLLSRGYFLLHVYWNISIFTPPERRFALHIMKYQHFHPPGTSFCSTYNEILTFSLSWGDLYYTYNKGTLRAQSQMHKDAFGRKSCHTFVWEANAGTKCGHTAGTMLNIHFLVTVDTSTMRAHCGHATVSQNKINSPEVTFTTRI